nr:uncharacterized protein LOC109747049 [Aegilops tauschii subsp. strangulata]
MEHSDDDADTDEAPAPPKPQMQKRTKTSKPSAAPKASRVKPLATAPPEASVQSEDLSRISKKTEKSSKQKMPIQSSGQELTPADILRNEEATIDLSSDDDLGDDALEMLIKSKEKAEIFNDLAIANELALAQKIIELKNKIDHEKAQFKRNMAKLSVADVQSFNQTLHDLKEEFQKKREAAKGSRERMKLSASNCVQVHNEAEKRKALGRPSIDPKLAAKKKKPVVAQAEASGREAPHIVFPTSMTGSMPKVPTAASELKKTRAAEAEDRKRKKKNATDDAPPTKKRKTKSSKKDRAAPSEPLVVEPISVAHAASANQERELVLHEPASIEAPEAADILAVDPIIAEDIGCIVG